MDHQLCSGPDGPSASQGKEAGPPGWVRQAVIVLGKDLAIEARSGEVLISSGFFAALVIVLASMAFYTGPGSRGQVAAGALWLSVAFAAVLGLGRMWQREREDGNLDALLVAPVSRSALFVGKAAGLELFLTVIELVVLPIAALLFTIDVVAAGPGLALITLLATPGVAATGTLFGAMTARTRARDLMLAVVLFPLQAPVLLTAVVATRELLGGAPLSELGDYFELLAVFDVVFVAAGVAMFGILLEE